VNITAPYSTVPIKLFFVALRIPGVLGYKLQRPIKYKKESLNIFLIFSVPPRLTQPNHFQPELFW
jgi:hypothetical protein